MIIVVELKIVIEFSLEFCVKVSYVLFKMLVILIIKWEGVSLFNNFKYEDSGICVWRVFNVGLGKLILWF